MTDLNKKPYLLTPRRTLFLILSICVFTACILPGIFLSAYSVHFFDEPYQILNSLDYKNAPLAPLSAFLGGAFGSLSGYSLIAYRYFALACTVISVLIGIMWMWRRTHDPLFTIVTGGTCLYLSTVFRTYLVIYGWDNLTLLSVTVSLVLFCSCISSPRSYKFILLGVASSAVILIRLPNGVIVPTALLLMFIFLNREIRFRAAATYLISVCLFSSIGIMLLYAGPSEYLDYFYSNKISDHSLYQLFIRRLPFDIIVFLPVVILFYGIEHITSALSVSNGRINSGKTGLICLILFLVTAFSALVYSLITRNITYKSYTMALWAFCLGYVIYKHRDNLRKGDGAIAISVMLFSLIPIAGSNTGLMKTVVWAVMPFLMSLIYPFIKRPFILSVGCIVAAFIFFSSNSVRYASIDLHLFDNLFEATSELNGERLSGMKTTEEKASLINGVIADMNFYMADGSEPFILRNGTDYIWEYALDSRNPFLRHAFSFNGFFDDPEYIRQVASYIGGKPYTVLFMRPADGRPSAMQSRLESILRPVKVTDSYIIFKQHD